MKYCNADEAGDKGTGYRRQNPHAAAGTRSRLAHIIPLFRFRIMNRHSPDERPDPPILNRNSQMLAPRAAPGQYVRPRMRRYSPDL